MLMSFKIRTTIIRIIIIIIIMMMMMIIITIMIMIKMIMIISNLDNETINIKICPPSKYELREILNIK